jgi:hypothetical protein
MKAGLALTKPAVAVTLYGPPAVPLAVKTSPNCPTGEELLVFAVMVFVLFENVPLAPVPGAVKVTGWFGMVTPPPSFTTTVKGVPNAEPVVALCVPPAVIVTDAGVCTTGTLLSVDVVAEPNVVCVRSPPPQALAVFETEVGEFAGTFTVT